MKDESKKQVRDDKGLVDAQSTADRYTEIDGHTIDDLLGRCAGYREELRRHTESERLLRVAVHRATGLPHDYSDQMHIRALIEGATAIPPLEYIDGLSDCILLLTELANTDCIDSEYLELRGEDVNGNECGCDVKIQDIAQKALDYITAIAPPPPEYIDGLPVYGEAYALRCFELYPWAKWITIDKQDSYPEAHANKPSCSESVRYWDPMGGLYESLPPCHFAGDWRESLISRASLVEKGWL
jgi:hypothetical protein